MNKVIYYSPLRYPGGKTLLISEFERILQSIGINKPIYIEPYAGGAGLALSLLFANRVRQIVINDLDKAIYSFWRAVTENSEKFSKKIIKTPITVSEWKKQKKIYLNQNAKIFDRGFATFFLNRTNRSGVMNAWPIGGIEQNSEYRINARYNRKDLAARVRKIGRYKNRIKVLNEDGIQLTERYLNQDNAFIYLDPPYLRKGAMLYLNHYEEADHEKLADLLNKNAKRYWVLTYDALKKVQNLYIERRRRRLDLKYRVRDSRRARELMIFSDMIKI